MAIGFTPFGSEFRINTYTDLYQTAPAVVGLADGGYVAIWNSIEQDGSGYGLYAQRYTASGATLGAEFQINTYTANDQYRGSIAAQSDGGFVVTWISEGQDGSGEAIMGQRFDALGTKVGSEIYINTFQTGDQSFPDVTTLSSGGFVVVWHSEGQDGSASSVHGRIYTGGGAAVGSEFQINTHTSNRQEYPKVIGLDDGGFIATWTSEAQDGSEGGVYGQRYNANGSALGAEFRINTETADHQGDTAAAALADGGFVIAWSSDGQDGDRYGVYGQRFDANGTADGAEFQINTETVSNQLFPTIAALADGGFVIAWMSILQDGDSSGIFGQRYDASGSAVGTEFQINTFTTGSQSFPRISGLADGGFTVVWESFEQYSLSWDIFAQQFAAELWGTAGHDEMIDSVGANWMNGQGGNDSLSGGSGNDTIFGASGQDELFGDSGNDMLDGGAGQDELDGGSGRDTLLGAGGNDTLIGGTGRDILDGGRGSDVLFGGGGVDELIGGNGNDILHGDGGADILDGGSGFDILFGGAGNDTLSGNGHSDYLSGDAGNDELFGGTGADILRGGSGSDIISGQAGADTFIFGLGDDVDEITDFNIAQDMLRLDDALWGGGLTASEVVSAYATTIGIDTFFFFGTEILILDGISTTVGLDAVLQIV